MILQALFFVFILFYILSFYLQFVFVYFLLCLCFLVICCNLALFVNYYMYLICLFVNID